MWAVSRVYTMDRKLIAWSLLDPTLCIFSFADSNLHLFAVLKHNHKCNSFAELYESV